MTTLVSKFQSTDGETGHYIEVYDQPLRNALMARGYHLVARVIEPVAVRLSPYYLRVTHLRGCPHPRSMTRVVDGSQTAPMCLCLPLHALIDYQGYRLTHRNRVTIRHFEVDESVYRAVSTTPWG